MRLSSDSRLSVLTILSRASFSGLDPEASMKDIRLEPHEERSHREEVISEKSSKQPQLFWPQTLSLSINK